MQWFLSILRLLVEADPIVLVLLIALSAMVALGIGMVIILRLVT